MWHTYSITPYTYYTYLTVGVKVNHASHSWRGPDVRFQSISTQWKSEILNGVRASVRVDMNTEYPLSCRGDLFHLLPYFNVGCSASALKGRHSIVSCGGRGTRRKNATEMRRIRNILSLYASLQYIVACADSGPLGDGHNLSFGHVNYHTMTRITCAHAYVSGTIAFNGRMHDSCSRLLSGRCVFSFSSAI